MVQYRTFRNTDPPRLVEVWNEAFTNRGAAYLPNTGLLERYVLAKPTFDPAGLFVAEDEGRCVGFGHAGLAPVGGEGPLAGVVCLIGVRPSAQRHGVGGTLLRCCEAYLRERGAQVLYAGGHYPRNPYYLGLYGGSESPGFLVSDAQAAPFFLGAGYVVDQQVAVLQRALDTPLRVVDPRFGPMRQRYVIEFAAPQSLSSTWRECVLGFLDPIEASVVDRQSGARVARALLWEMEGYTYRWQRAAAGVCDFEVDPAYRRQGLGKFFFLHMLRQLQEQFFALVEVQLEESNAAALQFLRSMNFQQVDTGQVFRKPDPGGP